MYVLITNITSIVNLIKLGKTILYLGTEGVITVKIKKVSELVTEIVHKYVVSKNLITESLIGMI